MTKRLLAVVAGAIGPVLFIAGSAEALSIGSVSGGGTPDGTATVTYEGSVTYNRPDGSTIITADGTIIDKAFTSLTAMSFEVTYLGSELDFANGFRWSERILNNTGSAWTDYHLTVGTPGVFFTAPPDAPAVVTISGTTVQGSPNGTVLVSPDKTQITFNFTTPIANGAYLEVHTPISDLSTAGGTFSLQQAPSVAQAVPVPGAGLAGMVLLAGMWLMKRGRGVEQ